MQRLLMVEGDMVSSASSRSWSFMGATEHVGKILGFFHLLQPLQEKNNADKSRSNIWVMVFHGSDREHTGNGLHILDYCGANAVVFARQLLDLGRRNFMDYLMAPAVVHTHQVIPIELIKHCKVQTTKAP